MKIALLGNCQLLQIGWLLKNYFQKNNPDHEILWHQPVYSLGNENTEIVALFHALEQADQIYMQYHENRWGIASTEQIARYFDIKIVPTLESVASYGQMNYFEQLPLKFNIFTVDFRMLDLYLKGIDFDYVPELYGKAESIPDRRKAIIENSAHKYGRLHSTGKVIFDYSDIYRNAMNSPSDPYFVHNHPNNAQLQWLMNEILRDSKANMMVNLESLPEILTDTVVPSLNQSRDDRYKLRDTEIGIRTAAKIYYSYFSTFDKDDLRKELESSFYRSLFNSEI